MPYYANLHRQFITRRYEPWCNIRVCVMLLLIGSLMTVCGQQVLDYGFAIKDVSIIPGYQTLNIHLTQDLALSEQALEALEHGVTLTIRLDLELRNDNDIVRVTRAARRFEIRYLPLSERFQLSTVESGDMQAFPRLRHVLAAINELNVQLPTGALPPGGYELRTRVWLDKSRLPTPMQLPAWFSSQWQHDSEWSVWPVKIGV